MHYQCVALFEFTNILCDCFADYIAIEMAYGLMLVSAVAVINIVLVSDELL